jgi:hypothetical protein
MLDKCLTTYAAILFKFTATIVPANAGRVAGIVTIATVSAVIAANGVAKVVVLTTASGSARSGTAIIDGANGQENLARAIGQGARLPSPSSYVGPARAQVRHAEGKSPRDVGKGGGVYAFRTGSHSTS